MQGTARDHYKADISVIRRSNLRRQRLGCVVPRCTVVRVRVRCCHTGQRPEGVSRRKSPNIASPTQPCLQGAARIRWQARRIAAGRREDGEAEWERGRSGWWVGVCGCVCVGCVCVGCVCVCVGGGGVRMESVESGTGDGLEQWSLRLENQKSTARLKTRQAESQNAETGLPLHICTGTGLSPATSAPGLRSPLPRLHRGKFVPDGRRRSARATLTRLAWQSANLLRRSGAAWG